MTFKDILVHVDVDKGAAARARLALELAHRYEAHLAGVCFAADPIFAATVFGVIPASILDNLRREAMDCAQTAAENFRALITKSGLACDCRIVDCLAEDLGSVLSLHARHADLVVLGQPDAKGGGAGNPELAATVAIECGRPALIVPTNTGAKMFGERVLVAWDGGREAARALNDALPILKHAKSVAVLSVNATSEYGKRRIPGNDISLHLARHGVTVEAISQSSSGAPVSEIILEEIVSMGADLLVMGVYGHSRLREFVLGGVTRDILSKMTVPVLMSH
jgi:nucleotide-binding universal stress UspA family protein